MKKILAVAVMAVSALVLAAAPSWKNIKAVTTTSQTVYMPLGYSLLECTGKVHYAVVAAASGEADTSDPMLKGLTPDGFMDQAWVNISSDRYLALLLNSGTTAKCKVTQFSSDGQTGSFTTLAVSSTSVFTGGVTVLSTFQADGITKLGVTDAGATAVNGTLNVTGAVVLTGATLQNDGVTKLGLTDAGSLAVTGTLNVAGDNIVAGGTKTKGTCTLNAASPSVCTATVNAGCVPTISAQTNASDGLSKAAVSSTTLTITGPNGSTGVMQYHCIQ